MMREPVATTKMRQVRVVANILTKDDLLPLLLNCASTRTQVNRGFAQSTLINVVSHGVVGGL
jgi:flagellar biosynthesis component FlhA